MYSVADQRTEDVCSLARITDMQLFCLVKKVKDLNVLI